MVLGPVVIELLLAAVGIAINPPAVIAAILLVASSKRKALAFAGGWLLGLLVVGGIVMAVGETAEKQGDPAVVMLVIKVVVGVALLWLAAVKWRKHRSASGDKELPGWMSKLSEISAPRAFIAAAAYASLNPKTIAFNAAGVLAILDAPFRVEAEWTALVVFALVASLSVTAPVIFAVLAPRRSAGALAFAERWLGENSSAVAAAVLLVLGLMVLYGGVDGLL
jgi:threonine/homoserine/homoserine lactone efflux protein